MDAAGESPRSPPNRFLAACDKIHEPLSALFKAVGTERLINEVFMAKGDAG